MLRWTHAWLRLFCHVAAVFTAMDHPDRAPRVTT
jgi:hypothetical protein